MYGCKKTSTDPNGFCFLENISDGKLCSSHWIPVVLHLWHTARNMLQGCFPARDDEDQVFTSWSLFPYTTDMSS